ncbi:23S rRNA pseudouridine1911/1915/1917 synthase [Hypnocyclicus thermotrophus]|uniref:Pseudouridine synthase n=1 Tax=Hypnocyclicus thermotrophus TaxID=1627895 RepID=A0AA46I503_9FUSO|nr:RluA family pseudouridine synthase [Hypnocyclicus thermotrophus]TDT68085.1 23S rRNA pseudouridine1911/1915/1917 synthase [Hypnocyclicus thermotrophus]
MYKEIKEFIVTENEKNIRLDRYISINISEISRREIQELIKNNNIEVIGTNKKIKASYKLKGIEKIIIKIPEKVEQELLGEDIDLDIIYEDKDILVINKQPDLVVHPGAGNETGTLVNAVISYYPEILKVKGERRPGIVHRLDKDTSGVIVIAKNNIAYDRLIEKFSNKKMNKTYLCIVKGRLKEKEGRIENLIGRDTKNRKKMTVVTKNGKLAISNYKVLDEKGDFTLIKVNIETGRTHQIRVHMKYLNHPILGDEVYGKKSNLVTRQMLHAYKLEMNHPITNEKISFIAKLPNDFKEILNKLEMRADIDE